MGRRKREYLPGAVFHITARSHCKEHIFDVDLRDVMVSIIARRLPLTDAELIAFAIMSNHYHLVIKQGNAPIAQLMQPINREIALAVQRKYRRQGHVFGGPFFAKPCVGPEQMREMIIYTHRNPVRAKLCSDASEWDWSSHGIYLGTCASTPSGLVVRSALELFADQEDGIDASEGYLAHLGWRSQCDELMEDEPRPRAPRTRFGDAYYYKHFVAAEGPKLDPERDLRDVILRSLKDVAPEVTLDMLRRPLRTRPFVLIRRAVIASATRARHRPRDIARFLNLSDTAVSRVAVTVRPRPPIRFDS